MEDANTETTESGALLAKDDANRLVALMKKKMEEEAEALKNNSWIEREPGQFILLQFFSTPNVSILRHYPPLHSTCIDSFVSKCAPVFVLCI